MATNFFDFSRLPKELRYMIWECALRPDVPGVHFKMNDKHDMPAFSAEGTVV
ncbi:Ff.00g004530.m01.CDS01 [Fusarium sp. VM40]|nr:Ff.00g004530.m01.CDS01 [Fusarium sp. VM40]